VPVPFQLLARLAQPDQDQFRFNEDKDEESDPYWWWLLAPDETISLFRVVLIAR
jgi:hypothetical protein